MRLREIIRKDCICILKGGLKEEVILELIRLIDASGEIPDVEKLKEGIFYRENLMSTGIGFGIAVPHVRIEGVRGPIVAIGISHNGIPDYESLDNKTVKIVVMIVAGKGQHKDYIRLLSLIVSKLKDKNTRERLIKAHDPNEIYDIFVEEDNV
jgi:mannitol/fructose-specific phosphotransferase system IIA component (Ntr-type)